MSPTTRYDTLGESSEATSPPGMDTAPWLQSSIRGYELSYHKQAIGSERLQEIQVEDARTRRHVSIPDLSTVNHDNYLSASTQRYRPGTVPRQISNSNWTFNHTTSSEYFVHTKPAESFDPGGHVKDMERVESMASTGSMDSGYFSSRGSGSNPELFRCAQCEMAFAGKYGKGNLRRHTKSVHQTMGKMLTCSACQKTFGRSDALRKHMRKKHRDLPALSSKQASTTQPSSHEHIFSSDHQLALYPHGDDIRRVLADPF